MKSLNAIIAAQKKQSTIQSKKNSVSVSSSVVSRTTGQKISISWQHCCQQFLDGGGQRMTCPWPRRVLVLMKPRPNSSTGPKWGGKGYRVEYPRSIVEAQARVWTRVCTSCDVGIFSPRLAATHTQKKRKGCTFCNVQSVSLYGLQLNLRNNRNTETATEEVIFSNIPKYEFRRIFLSGRVTNIINL